MQDIIFKISYFIYSNYKKIRFFIIAILISIISFTFLYSIILGILIYKQDKYYQRYLLYTVKKITYKSPNIIIPSPLKIEKILKIKYRNSKVNFLVIITNPNRDFSVVKAKGIIKEGGNSSEEIEFFVPPMSKRYIAVFNLDGNKFKMPDFEIKTIEWRRILSRLELENFNYLKFKVINKELIPQNPKFKIPTILSIKVENSSPFSFYNVDIISLIKDFNGNIRGIGRNKIENFKTGEKRKVDINLGYIKVSKEWKIEVKIYANLVQQNLFKTK